MTMQMRTIFKTASEKHVGAWTDQDGMDEFDVQDRLRWANDRVKDIMFADGSINFVAGDNQIRCIPQQALEWIDFEFRRKR